MNDQPKIQSLEELYDACKTQIYTLCRRLTGEKALADDLFSETWVKVAEKQGNIRRNGNPRAWVYTVCINLYRKSGAHRMHRVEHENFSGQEAFEANAEESLIEQEQSRALRKALAGLDDKYRIPLILFYFRDLSYEDIARIMKLPMSTVKYRLNQAKKLLKKEMEELK